MKNLWLDTEAELHADSHLDIRVYSSRLLGREADLVLHGGGNTSVKTTQENLFGEQERILYVKGSGWDLATIEAQGFAPVRLDVLEKMARLDNLTDSDMVKWQRAAMTDPNAPNPSVEAILHAIIPFRFVDHTHADAVVTLTNTPNGEQLMRELYGDRVLIVPYVMPGFILAKHIYAMIQSVNWQTCEAMILLNHGVFTFGDDAKTSYSRMIDIVAQAEHFIEDKIGSTRELLPINSRPLDEQALSYLAQLRRAVSNARGMAVYAVPDNGAATNAFANLPNGEAICSRGPLTPDHIIRTKRVPLIMRGDPMQQITDFEQAYNAYFERNAGADLTRLDPAPRWAVWPNHGIVSFGAKLQEADIILDIGRHTIAAIEQAELLGGWQALPESDLFAMEYWELEQAKINNRQQRAALQGKVVLVTGAASGIGKACVHAFLAQGAAVAALDIDPKIQTMFEHRSVVPLHCDVTDEQKVGRAVQQVIEAFGGLDILIANAGIFTANESIEQMSNETWDKSININLTSHQRLIKACIPYLKYGLDASIIIVASKNVPAPGPGASAYSSAKAGLTQLGRVAALELGQYNIRVNTIHPNAVFDTAVWSESVLAERAANYGLTIAAYKANNVLKTEVSSRDVAQMACAMAGNAFAKTTGAQVPVDGGNERVI